MTGRSDGYDICDVCYLSDMLFMWYVMIWLWWWGPESQDDMGQKVNRVMGWKSPETLGLEDPMAWKGVYALCGTLRNSLSIHAYYLCVMCFRYKWWSREGAILFSTHLPMLWFLRSWDMDYIMYFVETLDTLFWMFYKWNV